MRIKQTSVFVDEQDRALAFYTNILGFEKKHDVPEIKWLTVVSPDEPENVELLLEPNFNDAAKDFQHAMFVQGIPAATFAVEDVQEEYEKLKKRGVEFSMEPTKTDETTIAIFNDTCGNLIQIYENYTRRPWPQA